MKRKVRKCIGILVIMILLGQITAILPVFKESVKAATLNTKRVTVHDPSIVKTDGKYYIFGSHMSFASTSDLAGWNSFQTNINTEYESVFSESSKWASRGSGSYELKNNLWAPDVIYNKSMKKWCMYMSVNGETFYSSIAMATADNITGPYTYAGTIVYSGFKNESEAKATDYGKVTGSNSVASRYLANGSWNSKYGTNAIDPCVIYDANGELWMAYGSWFGGIYMLKLDNKTGLRDYSYKYSTKDNSSDEYLGTKLSGGYGCTGEGAYIVYDNTTNYYYLYLSYGGLNATDSFSGYHIRLFRSKDIKGPYKDAAGNTAICTSSNADQKTKGIKLFGNYNFSSLNGVASTELSGSGYMSGGHNSAIIDDDGQRYLVYHTRFNKGDESHQVRVHQQFMNVDGWPVTAVYEYLGSKISKSGYSNSDIAGVYEIVNHGNSASTEFTEMLKTSKVTLSEDGKITGDYNGSWKTVTGSDGNKYYCTMKIEGVTYKGVFFKQYDESAEHKNTMTFSLIGSNDQAIWGSKIDSDTSSKLDGTYYLKNVQSGLYLDVKDGLSDDATNIQQWEYNGFDSQKFKIVSKKDNLYYILTGSSNYSSCVDIQDGSKDDGINVMQWPYWGGDPQLFQINKNSDGSYSILTKATGGASAVEVYEGSKDSGANVVQWKYWGGAMQHWNLIPAK